MAGSKHRWTEEEEAAIRDGVSRHGVGRWSAILKDPEFQTVLQNRSNVDLKDKWRNMQIQASAAVQRPKYVRRDISKQKNKSVASTDAGNSNEQEIAREASEEGSMAGSKHKWTEEEEAAIRDGIRKHGFGRWSAILRDPEFQTVLQNRSNVDLKDKWRNMQQALSTGVQRPKYIRRDISKQVDNSVASTAAGNNNENEIAHAASHEVQQGTNEIDAVIFRIMHMNPEDAAAAAAEYVQIAEAAMAAAEEAEEEAAEAEAAAERADAYAAELEKEITEKKAATQPAAPARRPRSSLSRRRRT